MNFLLLALSLYLRKKLSMQSSFVVLRMLHSFYYTARPSNVTQKDIKIRVYFGWMLG